jgi:hypothetical protein
LKILFTFVTPQATLLRRSTVLILPAKLVFPEYTNLDGGLSHKTFLYNLQFWQAFSAQSDILGKD